MPAAPDDRTRIASDAADAVANASELADRAATLAGFDAFIDRITDVVDKRSGPGAEGYRRIDSIEAFGRRVQGAAGRSGNFELVVTREKPGGNAALVANALASLGAKTTFLGAVGASRDGADPHPIFERFARSCVECVPLAEPGQTDALEFDDGKIMLGKPASLDCVDWSRLVDRVGGVDALRRRCAAVRTLAFGNWTMHRAMDDIWRRLAGEALAGLDADRRPRMTFVDLADPSRRKDGEIADAMRALRVLHEFAPVTLGVNLTEARRVGAAVGAPVDLPEAGAPDGETIVRAAAALRDALGFRCVVVHSQRRSAASTSEESAHFDAPYTRRPAISTGAGDHFNAGFILGSSLDLPLRQRLACASACAGGYVRTADSPSRAALVATLRAMPEPEHD